MFHVKHLPTRVRRPRSKHSRRRRQTPSRTRGAPRAQAARGPPSRRAPRSTRARISRPCSRPSQQHHLPRPAPRTPLAASSRLTTAAIPRAPSRPPPYPVPPHVASRTRRASHATAIAPRAFRGCERACRHFLALSKTHNLTISTRPQSHYPLRCPYRRAEGSLWIISRSPSGRPLTDS